MRRLQLTSAALEDLKYWKETQEKIYQKIKHIIEQIRIDPTTGIGKPEPLKYEWAGYWSRRINEKHRLVYRFDNECVIIAQARYHYDKR